MNVFKKMRKLFLVTMLGLVMILGVACEETTGNDIEENTNNNVDEDPNNDETDNTGDNNGTNDDTNDDTNNDDEPHVPSNYYEELQIDGKTIDASSIVFHDELNESLDYSDDERTLADTSGLSDTDEITIPSESLKEALSTHYDIEAPIVYGDVKDMERLWLRGSDIESIAGIEYFESLSVLDLSKNPELTSIKGVEALDNLSDLDISSTMVKKVDYDMPSLEKFSVKKTVVDIDETNIESLIARWPALNTLDLAQTSFRVNATIVEMWDDWSAYGDLSAWLLVDYKQIDYETVGFDAFWDFEEGGYPWTRPGIDVDVMFSEDGGLLSEEINSLYVDITDPTYNGTLASTLDELVTTLGMDETDGTMEKITLVYEYFEEHKVVAEDGSTSVLDAYEHEAVTEETYFEAMALMYQYLDLPVYSNQVTYSTFTSTDPFEARVCLLYVVSDEGHFAIGSQEYFMVGSETIKTYVEDEIIKQGYDSDGPDLDLSFQHVLSEYDYNRDSLSEMAEGLNIDIINE